MGKGITSMLLLPGIFSMARGEKKQDPVMPKKEKKLVSTLSRI